MAARYSLTASAAPADLRLWTPEERERLLAEAATVAQPSNHGWDAIMAREGAHRFQARLVRRTPTAGAMDRA